MQRGSGGMAEPAHSSIMSFGGMTKPHAVITQARRGPRSSATAPALGSRSWTWNSSTDEGTRLRNVWMYLSSCEARCQSDHAPLTFQRIQRSMTRIVRSAV